MSDYRELIKEADLTSARLRGRGMVVSAQVIENLLAALRSVLDEQDAVVDAAKGNRATASHALNRSREMERDIALAIRIHVKSGYWMDEDSMTDENGEETEPEGYVCLTCSDSQVESDMENWNFDPSNWGVVSWPCETVRALTGGDPE